MFSYLGGKKFQAKWIGSYIPTAKKYVEPFGGAFWVYFQNGIEFNKNVYNDYNVYLANVLYCARNKFNPFLKELQKHETQNKDLFEQFKSELVPLKYDIELGDVETAAKYIYIELNTFSGLTIDKAKFVDLKGKYKSKYTQFFEKVAHPRWQYKLQTITDIQHQSYQNCILEHDSPDTFFYIDPPYFKKESYYTKLFPQVEHNRLSKLLKKIKGKFILSYYDFDDLNDLYSKRYSHWETRKFNKQNSSKSTNTEKGKEVIIMNYDPKTYDKFDFNDQF